MKTENLTLGCVKPYLLQTGSCSRFIKETRADKEKKERLRRFNGPYIG